MTKKTFIVLHAFKNEIARTALVEQERKMNAGEPHSYEEALRTFNDRLRAREMRRSMAAPSWATR